MLSTLAIFIGAQFAALATGTPAAQVDELFAQWARPDTPGCALGVIQDGEWLLKRGYGMANLEHGIPNTSETVFRIGSLSKHFTGMAILLLQQQGLLSLSDDIRRFLPELPEYEKPIQVSDLMYHTSGLRHYLTLLEMQGLRPRDGATTAEALGLLARQRTLNNVPGQTYLSSDTGYFLFSVIVERASGLSLREFAQKHIFEPLGMRDTHFHDDLRHVVENRADGHSPRPNGPGYQLDNENTLDVVGDGGIMTTVEDMLTWERNFLDDRLGADDALMEAFHRRGVTSQGEQLQHAAGIFVEHYRGVPAVHYSGGWVGFMSYMIRLPEQRFAVVCLCNVNAVRPYHLARDVVDIYLGETLPEPKRFVAPATGATARVSPARLRQWAGFYENRALNQVWRVVSGSEGLTIEDDYSTYDAVAAGGDEFHSTNTRYLIRFLFSQDPGDQARLRIERTGLDHYLEPRDGGVLELTRLEPMTLAESDVDQYLGRYWSEEIDVAYQLIEDDDVLFMRHENPHRSYFTNQLVAIAPVRFRATPTNFTFVRGQGGEITGVLLFDRHYVRGLLLARTAE
ncbi:MAG TPA: serine hydrolase domain-containing protein [Acidobacteriota bacterium]|nr:serine hydrolase domain-containing protein [Acidobacteriota bacterium]